MRLFGIWRMAPWWRGPWLLLRRPGVALALIAASFVAALPAAAASPFLSSATNATLRSQIANTCPWSVGLREGVPATPPRPGQFIDEFGDPLDPAENAKLNLKFIGHIKTIIATDDAHHDLAAPITTLTAVDSVSAPGTKPQTINLMSRDDFASHVTVLAGPVGAGAWIPDTLADSMHVTIGDQLKITIADLKIATQGNSADVTTTRHDSVPVAAVYRDLRSLPDAPWWCTERDLYRGVPGKDDTPVFPLVLVDQATVLRDSVDVVNLGIQFDIGLADPNLAVDDVPRAVKTINKISKAAFDAPAGPNAVAPQPQSDLATFIARANLARQGVRPGVVPITVAGVLVGMLVVAAAGVFWVLRRRRELTLLSAHGIGAASLGVKAAIECTPALIIGTALALGAAWQLVRRAGPGPTISPPATGQSLLATAASLAAAILVVALAAGLRARTLADEVHRRHAWRLTRLPWELLLIGAAIYAWRRLGASTLVSGTAGGDAGAVVHVPSRLLVVPILIITGVVAFAFRLTAYGLRRRRGSRSSLTGSSLNVGGANPDGANGSWPNGSRPGGGGSNGDGPKRGGPKRGGPKRGGSNGRGRNNAWFLGWRRLIREAAIVAILGAATAMPIALATYGATVTNSVKATVIGESEIQVGTDVVVDLIQPAPIPASLQGQATEVLRLNQVVINGIQLDVLAVDPAQFAKVAFWQDSIDGTSLDGLLAPLRAPHVLGTPWPAVASGRIPDGVGTPRWALSETPQYDVRNVAILPAPEGGYGVMIVNRASIDPSELATHTELWIRGDGGDIRTKIGAARLPVRFVNSADLIDAHTIFEPLTYTFEYLSALSLLTGVVTAVGLLLYLEARTPGHRRGYVMLRRMGMANRTHRLALLTELAAPLLAGLLAGLALAYALAEALAANFDIDVTVPPGTLLTFPGDIIGGICLAVLAMTLLATSFAQLRISHANPSEVLRDSI